MVDDILDAEVALARVVNVLKENGVKEVCACVSHELLSDYVKNILDDVPVKDICITDSVFIEENHYPGNLVVVTCSELMREAVKRIHENISISPLSRLEEERFE